MTAVTGVVCYTVAPDLYNNAIWVVVYLLQRGNTGIFPNLAMLPFQELVGVLGATVSGVLFLKYL